MKWSDHSPRAVAPSIALRAAQKPELGSYTHSKSSPHPYGIGVYIEDENGDGSCALPLYYVSEAVATARGRGVLEGWYVVARLGETFSIRLTRVTGSDPPPAEGALGSSVKVVVDGVKVDSGGYRFKTPHFEIPLHGFWKSKSWEGCSRTIVEQQFQFQRYEISESHKIEDENVLEESTTAGCIQLCMYSGPLVLKKRSNKKKQNNFGAMLRMSEKTALKNGLSVGVARDGKVRWTKYSYSDISYSVQFKGTYDEIVNVYFREQFWLETRCIVDRDGNAWITKKDEPIVDSVKELEVLPHGKGAVSKKNAKRGLQEVEKNKAKRVKKEVVDLTLVDDGIDQSFLEYKIDQIQAKDETNRNFVKDEIDLTVVKDKTDGNVVNDKIDLTMSKDEMDHIIAKDVIDLTFEADEQDSSVMSNIAAAF